MGSKKNLYEVLGVASSTTQEEIIIAWGKRKNELAMSLLQPLPPNTSREQLQEEVRNQFTFIQHAKEVLTSPDKRTRYDESIATDHANAPLTINMVEYEAVPRKNKGLPIALLAVAIGAGTWQWQQKLSSSTPPPSHAVADVEEVTQSENESPASSTADFTITTTPSGSSSVPLQNVKPPSPAKIYSIEIDSEDAVLLKKLVWSVYKIVGSRGLGTGILVDKEQLLTNCHVIASNANHGPIRAINSVTQEATEITEVAWLDHEDACLVKAPGLTGTIATVALQSPTSLGAHTHNLGFAKGQLTGSQGEVIGWSNRFGQKFMVTSNYCDHGVSGGPLVDDDGRLIGLTTGGPTSLAFCVSVTLDTVSKLRMERLKPLNFFPANYTSNVSRNN